MSPETSTVLSGGALAVIVIDRVLNFLKRQPNGKEHALLIAKLDEIREDTKACRSQGHTLINGMSGMTMATSMMIQRLEKL